MAAALDGFEKVLGKARQLEPAGDVDARAHRGGGFAKLVGAELGEREGGRLDVQVDAVEQETAEPAAVPRHLRRQAAAFPRWIARILPPFHAFPSPRQSIRNTIRSMFAEVICALLVLCSRAFPNFPEDGIKDPSANCFPVRMASGQRSTSEKRESIARWSPMYLQPNNLNENE